MKFMKTEDDKTGAASFSFQGLGFLKSNLKKRTMTDKLPSSFFFFVNHHPHRIRPRPRPTSPPRSSRPGLALAPRTWRTDRRRDSSREEIFVCKRGALCQYECNYRPYFLQRQLLEFERVSL